jgi:hypothetical protein
MGAIQTLPSTVSGEVTPRLLGRVDVGFWKRAAQTLENFVLWPQGPIQSRPGTQHLKEVKDSDDKCRLIPFVVSETVSYALEFGDQYIRFYKEDTVTGPGRIENPPGTPVEVVSPYLEAELFDVQIQQSIDVIYLIHPNHAPRKLTRFSDTVWVLSTLAFNPAPTAELPIEPAANITLGALTGTGISLTASAGVFQNGDVQRIIKAGTGRATITAFTSSTVVTVDIIDDFDQLSYTSGNWTMEGSPFGEVTPSDTGPEGGIITLTSTGEAEVITNLILATASCPSTDWTASGSGTNEYYLLNSAAGYTATEPDRVKELGVILVKGSLGSLGIAQWGWGDNDALGYNTIYIRLTDEADPDSKCGDVDYVQRATVDPAADLFRAADVGKFIAINGGFTKITSFTSVTEVKAEVIRELDNDTATYLWTLEDEVWSASLGYPATIALHEGRLFLGRTATFPQTVWASVSDDFTNFAKGENAGDSFKFTLSGPQNNAIKWMVSRQDLLVGTEGAEWLVRSSGPILTPSDVSAKIQTTNGSHGIQPVIIDSSVLHIQRKARKLRELSFDFVVDSYISPDRTILAEHITSGGMVQMAYAEEPLKTLWIVRGDGELLGFTFMRDEQVIAWHRHIAAGSFNDPATGTPGPAVIESIAVIPHPTDDYDQLWVIVKRTVDNSTVRYVEVFKKLFDSDNPGDSWALDSAAQYSGAATTTITGLDHLEGETVSVVNLATNGSYVGDYTVSGAEITLEKAIEVAIVGLKYTCTVKKLPMTIDIGAQGLGQKKAIKRFILSLYRTIGGKVGFGTEADENIRFKSRDGTMSMSQVADMKTGNTNPINVPGGARQDWEPVVQQDLPLPMTLLAIMPEGEFTSGTDG